jgi:hypothetical protein
MTIEKNTEHLLSKIKTTIDEMADWDP